jgi:low temperature requirement protein LtrA
LRRELGEEGDRHATWYELYFDLVFVGHRGAARDGARPRATLAGFLRFAGLFVPIAWAWTGFTFYANRFDTDDVVYRLQKAARCARSPRFRSVFIL